MEKKCNRCGITQDVKFFSKRTYGSGTVGYQNKCKSCEREVKKQYYRPHEFARRLFKLSDEEYFRLIEDTQGKCDGCKEPMGRKVCIDHCHKTQKIRGVLCNRCNTALGLVDDSTEKLEKLIQYLEQAKQLA